MGGGRRDGTRDRMGIGDPNNATKTPTALPAYENDLLWQEKEEKENYNITQPTPPLIGQRSGYRLALSGIQFGVTNSARPHSENTKFFSGGVQDGKMEEVRSCH